MVRALIAAVLVAVTVVFQLTVVDRIAFPGGSAPDLVLLVVLALALASGPMTGALTGFWAGLALDVAPPGSHFTGQDALVFCLIGYACGLLADGSSGDGVTEPGHTALFEIVVIAAGAVCGEALVALLGVMLSDPRVSWPAITHVLPVAVAYDVLLCPFVLYAVAAALRLAGTRHQARRVGWSPARAAGTPVPVAGLGAIRQLGGNTPRLRMADRGRGAGGGHGLGAAGRPAAGRREPQLKLGHSGSLARRGSLGRGELRRGGALGHSGSLAGGAGAAFTRSGAAKVRFSARRHEGVYGGSMLGGTRGGTRGGGRPASSALRSSGLFSSGMGRSWLGGSVFSRSSSSLGPGASSGRSTTFSRSASLGRSSPLRHRGNLMRSPGGLGGHAPRVFRGRGSGLARFTDSRRGLSQPRSPGHGWLRRTRRTRRNAFGRGALRGASRRGAFGPARLHMPRPKSRRRWRTGGYR
jgi:rod shape-determining protein MreD